MTEIVLTFAELDYLLGADLHNRRRLHLPEAEQPELIVASGCASLAARGLLEKAGDDVLPRNFVREVLGGVTAATTWIELGLAREEGTGGVQVFDSPTARTQVVARPLGTFELRSLDPGESLASAVSELAVAFLVEERPGAVVVQAEHADGDGVRRQGFGVRRLPSGVLEIAEGDGTDGGVATASLDQVESRCRALASA